MARWFTADTHFSHANIIKYCKRPFEDTVAMNNQIVSNINELVSGDDELWILGDIAMGLLDESLPIVKKINAKKILVAGNHDRCHPYYGNKSESYIQKYVDETGAIELHTGNTNLTLMDGTEVAVSHFPYAEPSPRVLASVSGEDNANSTDKFAKYRPVDNGGWLLCGHVHEKWAVQGRQVNVGIDAWGGYPVAEATIVEIVKSKIHDKSRIIWK